MASTSKTEYKYTGHYAHTLESGQPIEPGQVVKLDKDEAEANKDMIDMGLLVNFEKEGKEA